MGGYLNDVIADELYGEHLGLSIVPVLGEIFLVYQCRMSPKVILVGGITVVYELLLVGNLRTLLGQFTSPTVGD